MVETVLAPTPRVASKMTVSVSPGTRVAGLQLAATLHKAPLPTPFPTQVMFAGTSRSSHASSWGRKERRTDEDPEELVQPSDRKVVLNMSVPSDETIALLTAPTKERHAQGRSRSASFLEELLSRSESNPESPIPRNG